MLIIVLSWKRPLLLQKTLDSLCWYKEDKDKLIVVDNGDSQENIDVIKSHPKVKNYLLLHENNGINYAYEEALKIFLDNEDIILTSDGDILYNRPLKLGEMFLNANQDCKVVSYQNSPEHKPEREILCEGYYWIYKKCERGCALMLKTEFFQSVRPLPVYKKMEYDYWLFRDSKKHTERVSVLKEGAYHLGWHKGESTWQKGEVKEFVYI